MAIATEDTSPPVILFDRRLERVLSTGQRINDLRSKIQAATEHIREAREETGVEDVILVREALRGELLDELLRARDLLPTVDEMVREFEQQIYSIQARRILHKDLARLERSPDTESGLESQGRTSASEVDQIAKLESLVSALTELGRDMTSRKEVVSCPRCHSRETTYTITPSEFGYSIYKCRSCSNAWRIKQFSLQIG